MINYRQKQYTESNRFLFIAFLCQIEGWKTRCKNLHWAAPKKNIHVYLDEFLDVLVDYQDALAEGYMGIFDKLEPTEIEATLCVSDNAMDFINEVKEGVLKFYRRLPDDIEFKGIAGETESLIQNVNKYKYLFSLCFGKSTERRLFSDLEDARDTSLIAATGGIGGIGLSKVKPGRLTGKVV